LTDIGAKEKVKYSIVGRIVARKKTELKNLLIIA